MEKHQRPRLTDRQKLCLLMIWDHGLTGSHTEFSKPETRRTVHSLHRKKLVQWRDARWLVTVKGYAEASMLSLKHKTTGS